MRHRISWDRAGMVIILMLLWIRPRTTDPEGYAFVEIGGLILLFLAWPWLIGIGHTLANRIDAWVQERGIGVIEDDRAQAAVHPHPLLIVLLLLAYSLAAYIIGQLGVL